MGELMRRIRTRWYWIRYSGDGLPVTFHLYHRFRCHWSGIYGVQIGTAFIGVVTSHAAVEQLGPEPE